MFGTFLITLRELAELALIAGTLAVGLGQARQWGLVRLVLLSVLLGAAVGGALGASLLDWAELDLRSTALLHIGMAIGILVLVSTSLLAESRITLGTGAWLKSALERPWAPWAVACFACFVAGREVLEIVVLLNSVWKPEKAAAQLSGVAAAAVAVVLLGLAWKTVGARVQSLALFRLSALVTGVVAVELFLDGMASFLYAQGMLYAPDHWMVGVSRALEAGSWVGWACIAIMAFPSVLVFRSLWREASPA